MYELVSVRLVSFLKTTNYVCQNFTQVGTCVCQGGVFVYLLQATGQAFCDGSILHPLRQSYVSKFWYSRQAFNGGVEATSIAGMVC